MAESISDLIARHPCPTGHVPVKAPLGELIDRYGVGGIPVGELHRINTVTGRQAAALKAKAHADARAAAARRHDAERADLIAGELEAMRHG